jgi:hypothetical protein
LASLLPTCLAGQTLNHGSLDKVEKFIQPPCCDPPSDPPPPPSPPPPPPPDPAIGGPEEFNAALYVNIYPDLMNVYGSNLSAATTHWKNWGLPAGRRASPIFDPQYYLQHNSDIQSACGSGGYVCAMQHFMNQGLPNEGRRGSLEFDVRYYLSHNSDLSAAFGPSGYLAAADHFINQGLPNEGRTGSADFDIKNYVNTYPDVKAAYGATAYNQAFIQWLRRGVSLGRSAPAGPLPALLPLAECNPNVAKPAGFNRIFVNNGPGGPGTPGDTYDGSTIVQNGVTVYQLDNLLRDISEGRSLKYGRTNLIVCLGPGVFQTEGDYDYLINVPHQRARGFTVGQSWHVHGAGVGSTTLQLASFFLPTVVAVTGQVGCDSGGGCESGTIQMTVNGLTETIVYDGTGANGPGSVQGIANALASAFSGDSRSGVAAQVTQGPVLPAGSGDDWLIRFVTKGTDLDVNYLVSTSVQPFGSGLPATTLAFNQQLSATPSDPPGASNVVISTNADSASGIEVSDLTIDDNFQSLIQGAPAQAPLNLEAIHLRSDQGGHYIHRVNVVNAIGRRSEAFPVSIGSVAYNNPGSSHANPSSPPSQDNTIEYVTMSNWGGGACTAITLVFATGTARFNVVNGYQIAYGGWEMPSVPQPAPQAAKVASFSDNFAINTDYGFNVDSEYNNGTYLYFNQIIHPGRFGIVIGGSTRFTGFTLLYNTIEINRNPVVGIVFQGSVTNTLVARNDLIGDQGTPAGGTGILIKNGNNASNTYQFNQIFSALNMSPVSLFTQSCIFGNWNEVGTQRTDFPNNVTSPCVSGI